MQRRVMREPNGHEPNGHLFKNGHKKYKGRVPGTKNKIPLELKEAILTAMDKAGGKEGRVGYLLKLAHKRPEIFVRLIEKLMPTQVTGKDGGPVRVVLSPEHLRDLSRDKLEALEQLLLKYGTDQKQLAAPVIDVTAYEGTLDNA